MAYGRCPLSDVATARKSGYAGEAYDTGYEYLLPSRILRRSAGSIRKPSTTLEAQHEFRLFTRVTRRSTSTWCRLGTSRDSSQSSGESNDLRHSGSTLAPISGARPDVTPAHRHDQQNEQGHEDKTRRRSETPKSRMTKRMAKMAGEQE
jgi:hypothetical protein